MPVRLLRDWTDSEPIEELEWSAEVFFIRVIMKADDHGRFHGNPKLLKSLCFPLRSTVRESDISRWLDALQKAGLIRLYVAEGKPVIEVSKFRQQARSKSKFPDPPESVSNRAQPQTVAHLGGGGGGDVFEGGGGEPAHAPEIPTAEEVVTFGKGCTPVIPPAYCLDRHSRFSEDHLWLVKGRLIDWRAKFRRYWMQDKETWGQRRAAAVAPKPERVKLV